MRMMCACKPMRTRTCACVCAELCVYINHLTRTLIPTLPHADRVTWRKDSKKACTWNGGSLTAYCLNPKQVGGDECEPGWETDYDLEVESVKRACAKISACTGIYDRQGEHGDPGGLYLCNQQNQIDSQWDKDDVFIPDATFGNDDFSPHATRIHTPPRHTHAKPQTYRWCFSAVPQQKMLLGQRLCEAVL